uniref:TSC22 domain family member 3 n=1 Tax=Monodelphis domestica TaxID=13616 RepID=F6RKG5_MONDO
MALSSPVGLDCCTCCLDLASRSGQEDGGSADGSGGSGSGSGGGGGGLREQLLFANLNADKLNRIMRQDSLEPVVRDPCYLLNEGICNRNIDQTMLSILLFFHRAPVSALGFPLYHSRAFPPQGALGEQVRQIS